MKIYILLFLVAIVCEFSPYMNTKSIFKKFALILIAIGALVTHYGRDNNLIAYGAVLFFATCVMRSWYCSFSNKLERRAAD